MSELRWEELSARDDRARQLPGLDDGVRVRTFDAPEAAGIRFHEVNARSALNRVRGSRLPFNYTVNPYRGCAHACVYCMSGETPILMADGRTKPLAEVEVGDAIYGTILRGSYRRYVTTEVLAHWSTIKAAYRITLEDGTELVASGDHRFLTDRGWKFVTGTEQGRLRRPHLTPNNALMGVGHLPAGPAPTVDYKRGYLCGVIRGDGHLGSYSYDRPGRTNGEVHRFRLALVDLDALQRARDYLDDFEVQTREFLFHAGTIRQRPLMAIRTSAREKVAAVRQIIEWPREQTADWTKGFLAGIFDAEGSYLRGILRISNSDRAILDRTSEGIARLGLDACLEPARPNGVRCIRVRGGLRDHMRFFHTVDPAITRKRRMIDGTAIKSNANLGVASIKPLTGKRKLFDITTGTDDFIANGVVSHNCFARRTHPYLGLDAGRDFEREIVVKVNVPELVRAELGKPSWKRERVALGTNTDPYQWAESRYRLMPGILAALRDHRTPVSILSKSPLVLRDLALYKELAEVAKVSVNLSVPTIEEKAWRATEPHTPHPRARLAAVAELNRNGIPSGVMVAPLIPGINDDPEQVEEIVRLAEEAGATFTGSVGLHLRDEVRDVFMGWLELKRPDLVPRYEQLYAGGRAYLPAAERRRLSSLVARARRDSRGDRGGRSRSPSPARPASHPRS